MREFPPMEAKFREFLNQQSPASSQMCTSQTKQLSKLHPPHLSNFDPLPALPSFVISHRYQTGRTPYTVLRTSPWLAFEQKWRKPGFSGTKDEHGK
jgi:hypothetical protein